MSFNPARMPGVTKLNKSRAGDPYAGIKHSQINPQLGPEAVFADEAISRVKTEYGWKLHQFTGKFEVQYRYVLAGNSMGRQLHKKKSRHIRVLAGTLYVMSGGKTNKMGANQTVNILPEVEYVLASSGSGNVELLICQEADYEKDLIQVSPPESMRTEELMSLTPEAVAATVRKPVDDAARARSEKMAEGRRRKREAKADMRAPIPGQEVAGVSPMPVGPGGYGED
jgi:mannose-6-phosphate isomerase-like protein (cupin superfamily)